MSLNKSVILICVVINVLIFGCKTVENQTIKSTTQNSIPSASGRESQTKSAVLNGASKFNAVDSLKAIQEKHALLGMVAILIKDGKPHTTFYSGYGKADSSLVINGDTQFRIASISKTLTMLAIMKLWEDGKLSLDEDVSTYLGWTLRNPSFPEHKITLRLLMNHLSSIRDGSGYMKFVSAMIKDSLNIKELFQPEGKYFSDDMFADSLAPGTYFSYSNSAWGIVASIVEKVSGERFDTYTKSHLFEPLGMKASFNVLTADLNNLAILYRAKDGNWIPQTDDYTTSPPTERAFEGYIPGTNGLLYGPQGSLRISTNDLIKLSQLFFKTLPRDKSIVSPATLDTSMASPWVYSKDTNNGDTWGGFWFSYAKGLHLLSGKKGDRLLNNRFMFGHPGIAYGLLSDFYLSPSDKTGYIFITNGSKNPFNEEDESGFYEVEHDVARIFNQILEQN